MTRAEFIQRAVLVQLQNLRFDRYDPPSAKAKRKRDIARAAVMADLLEESGHAPWVPANAEQSALEQERAYYRRNPGEPMPEHVAERLGYWARKNEAELALLEVEALEAEVAELDEGSK